jgi:hypothetical protein
MAEVPTSMLLRVLRPAAISQCALETKWNTAILVTFRDVIIFR